MSQREGEQMSQDDQDYAAEQAAAAAAEQAEAEAEAAEAEAMDWPEPVRRCPECNCRVDRRGHCADCTREARRQERIERDRDADARREFERSRGV